MDHSPLARLPPELRNNIYELVFKQETPVAIPYSDGIWDRHYLTDHFALTKTCRQIYAESSQIFFSCNTFMLIAESSRGRARPCLDSLVFRMGVAKIAALRRFHIDLTAVGRGLYGLRSVLTVVTEIQETRELMAKCWIELRFSLTGVELGEQLSLVWDPQDPNSVQETRQQCVKRIDAWEAKGNWRNDAFLDTWGNVMARDIKSVLKEVW